jgi:hypothetical protein
MARIEMIMLLIIANMKLEPGDTKMLAMTIGSVNGNNVRPPETLLRCITEGKSSSRKVRNRMPQFSLTNNSLCYRLIMTSTTAKNFPYYQINIVKFC